MVCKADSEQQQSPAPHLLIPNFCFSEVITFNSSGLYSSVSKQHALFFYFNFQILYFVFLLWLEKTQRSYNLLSPPSTTQTHTSPSFIFIVQSFRHLELNQYSLSALQQPCNFIHNCTYTKLYFLSGITLSVLVEQLPIWGL